MRKTRIFLMIAGAALAAGVGFWRLRGDKQGRAESARTVQAEEGPLELTVEATGEVSPLNRVEIKPPIQGRIENILVDEGSRVEQGQVLAWMSSSDRAAILDAARAQGPETFKKWEDTYKPTPIVAPLSGLIILRNIVVGQTVDMGAVLFALSDKLIVLAHVDEVDIGRIKPGLSARIALDAYPALTIPGRVASVLYEGKNVSNVITYGVKVEPEKVPPFFRSQMTANVNFVIETKERAVLVPSAAVREGADGQKEVLVPGPDGKPVPKPVTVGLGSGDLVEISSGLAAGDSVLVTRKRYVPQKNDSSSPLIPTAPRGGRANAGGSRSGSR